MKAQKGLKATPVGGWGGGEAVEKKFHARPEHK
jgi:hypothetical protein